MAGGMYMHTSIIIAENAHEAEDATKARLKKAYGGFQTVNRVKIHTPNRGISLRKKISSQIMNIHLQSMDIGRKMAKAIRFWYPL